jgi:hypothetical protein
MDEQLLLDPSALYCVIRKKNTEKTKFHYLFVQSIFLKA